MSNSDTQWVAYYRVSTDKQGRSGLGLQAQEQAVRTFVDARRGALLAELVEVESGRRADRPQLVEALRLCRVHDATLVIAKLDRLARNVAFVSNLMDSTVEFIAVDFPAANRLTIHILAAVAEHEASLIRERTKAALGAAKARGVKLGGDRGNLGEIYPLGLRASARKRSERARARAGDLLPLLVTMEAQGLSIRRMGAELDQRGIKPSRGGLWSPSQVHRLLKSGA